MHAISLKWWLTALILSVVAAVIVVSWLLVTSTLQTRLEKQELQTLRNSLGLAQQSLDVAGTGSVTSAEARKALRCETAIIDGRLDSRMIILDESAKQIIADSRQGMPLNLANYPLVAEATLSGTTETAIVSEGETEYAAAARVVSLGPSPIGGPPSQSVIVMLIGSLDDARAGLAVVRERLALAFGVGFGVAAIVGLFAAHIIGRRLRRIRLGAQVIAGGDFTGTIRIDLHDEIGQLAEEFNAMGRQLADVFACMDRQGRRMSAVLDTLEEGLMGIDAEGRISIASRAAQDMLGPSLYEGMPLETTVLPQVMDIWRLCSEDGQTHASVIDVGARTLEATIYPIRPVGHATDTHFAVALRDVTVEVRLECARRMFLAKASHELKTPLFSLAGYVDILAEDLADETQRAHFVQKMKQQVDRMRRLAVDLLDLTQIEAGAIELHPTVIDPVAVVGGVAEEFAARAAARGVRIDVRCPDVPLNATADGERLGQIVRNLTDNAVKFSADNGLVLIELTADNGKLVITISDAGAPIPNSEIPYVFEPFYVGQESRRRHKGAGLGLAIARELALHMGGSLDIDQSSDHLVRFVLCVPLGSSTQS